MSWPPKTNCSSVRILKRKVKEMEEKLIISDIVWEERKMEESYDFCFNSCTYIYTFKMKLFKGNIRQLMLLCLSKVEL